MSGHQVGGFRGTERDAKDSEAPRPAFKSHITCHPGPAASPHEASFPHLGLYLSVVSIKQSNMCNMFRTVPGRCHFCCFDCDYAGVGQQALRVSGQAKFYSSYPNITIQVVGILL